MMEVICSIGTNRWAYKLLLFSQSTDSACHGSAGLTKSISIFASLIKLMVVHYYAI